MKTKEFYKMPRHERANCRICVVRDYSGIIEVSLISYETKVCGVKCATYDLIDTVFCTGTYSATTRKHIEYFCTALHLFGRGAGYFDYYDFKAVYESGEDVAISYGAKLEFLYLAAYLASSNLLSSKEVA